MEPNSTPTLDLGSDAFVTPRISDPFFQKLVEMHRARAMQFRQTSYGLLFATTVIVLLGILLFWRGDPDSKVLAKEEVDAMRRLDKLREDLNKSNEESAQVVGTETQLERVKILSTCLGKLPLCIDICSQDEEWSSVDDLASATQIGKTIAESLCRATPRDEVVDVSEFFPTDTKRFSMAVITRLKGAIEDAGLSTEDLRREISAIGGQVDKVVLAKPSDGKGRVPSALLNEVVQLYNTCEAVKKLQAVKNAVDEQLRKAEAARLKDRELAPETARQRERLQAEAQLAEKKLHDIEMQRNRILFMAWVPDLTVRIGAIILLLFLTRVLLATYRYTLGLSSFYLARSDIIQMLQPGNNQSSWYAPEQLRVLAECFAPDALKIDSVTDPTDQVARLAEAWIGRKK